MTLETIYYVGQTVAVVAILVSLVAIYIQQRKDHILARAENQRAILQQTAVVFDYSAETPTRLKSVQQCLVDFEGATAEQQVDFGIQVFRFINLAEQADYMRKDGLIQDASSLALFQLAGMMLGTPGGREYWRRTRSMISDDVVQIIDAYLAEHPNTLEALIHSMPYYRQT